MIDAKNKLVLNNIFFIAGIIFCITKMAPYVPGMVTLLSKVVVLLSKQELHLLPELSRCKPGFFVKYAGEIGFFVVTQFITNFGNR